jgi:hypothetical protein
VTLIIEYSNGVLDAHFARWLVNQVKQELVHQLNPSKLDKWDDYLNSGETFEVINVKRVSSREILLSGIRGIVYELSPYTLTIHIDRNQKVFGLNNVKLETVCKLINYGNTSISGYPLFSEVFSGVRDNIGTYIDRYVSMGI